MLLFNIKRKAYVVNPFVQLYLTSVGWNLGHSDFEELYLVKEQS